jgi:hypothetical protein
MFISVPSIDQPQKDDTKNRSGDRLGRSEEQALSDYLQVQRSKGTISNIIKLFIAFSYSSHTVKVEKFNLSACSISPLFRQIKFHMPWHVK